jgi:hypothetical protein
MRRNLIAVWKRDHQAHPHGIVGHGRGEIESIAREINHLANVLDLGESGVEGPNMQRQENPQPLPAAGISGCLFGASV